MESGDTIAAPITALGAVCVVRLSGPKTAAILQQILPFAPKALEQPGRMLHSDIVDPSSLEKLDDGMAVFFRGPHSYTGEDSAELSIHGSAYLLRRIMELFFRLGARSARPGEFTERAFFNGKMDLSQAEAVADLIAAQSESQARAAREQLDGKLSQAVSDLGEPLRDLLAEIEARIDFPEEDVEAESLESWRSGLAVTERKISSYTDSFAAGRLLREGARVVIAGLPNAGKSSLLNALLGEDRAIVTPIAGTTRDSIEAHTVLEGLLVKLWDTAGLTDESESIHRPGEIERIGIEQSWKRLRNADLIVYLVDGTADFAKEKPLFAAVERLGRPVLTVLSKGDLASPPLAAACAELRVSTVTCEGLDALRKRIAERLIKRTDEATIYITTERHYEALLRARDSIREALEALAERSPMEIPALLIRSALTSLQEIIGVTTNEDILGRIFSKFCIGK